MPHNTLKFNISDISHFRNQYRVSSSKDLLKILSTAMTHEIAGNSIDLIHTLNINLDSKVAYTYANMLCDLAIFLNQLSGLESVIIDLNIVSFSFQHSFYLSEISALKKLTIHYDKTEPHAIEKLAQFPSLCVLKLDHKKTVSKPSDVLRFLARWQWPLLSKLHLAGFRIENKTILDLLNNNPIIKSLNLTRSEITYEGATFLASAQLHDLTVHASPSYTDSQAVFELSKCSTIKSFQFNYPDSDGYAENYFVSIATVKNWTLNTNLTQLSLKAIRLAEGAINLIQKIPNLKSLILSEIDNFNDEPTSDWLAGIEAISSNHKISKLGIGNIYCMSETYGKSSLELLLKMKHVKNLSLDNHPESLDSRNSPPDYVISALANFHNLEYLSWKSTSFGDLGEGKFENFIAALATFGSIQHLALSVLDHQDFEKLLMLPRLQNLSIDAIFFDDSLSSEMNWKKIIATVSRIKTLTSFKFHNLGDEIPSTSVKSEIQAALNSHQQQKTYDLQQYINRCNQFIQGWFDPQSLIANLPKELIICILYEYTKLNDLIWKSPAQRISMVECLTASIFTKYTRDNYQSKPIKITEKKQYGENTFSLFFKPLPTKKRSHVADVAIISSPSPIKYLRSN